jgi:hypothetical protein
MSDRPNPDPLLGRDSVEPVARDVPVSDDDRIVRLTNQARQGKRMGSMRWVLGLGILFVVIGFVISYFIGRT